MKKPLEEETMMTAEVSYLGELRTQAHHLRSGDRLMTDAPVDNQGRGEAFSPTDLLAAALCSCMLTIMGIKAEEWAVDLRGTHIAVEKIMNPNPRRIARLRVNVYFTAQLNDRQRKVLEAAALTCPVAKSLHADIVQDVHFHYPV